MVVVTLLLALALAPQPPDSSLVIVTCRVPFRDSWYYVAQGFADSAFTSHAAVHADTTTPRMAGWMVAASRFRTSAPSPVRLTFQPSNYLGRKARLSRAVFTMEVSPDGRGWSTVAESEGRCLGDSATAEFDLQPWLAFAVRWIVRSDASGVFALRADWLNTKAQRDEANR